MRHPALDVIRGEHQALAAVLSSLTMLLAQARRAKVLPDFEVLRAMLFYVDEFPERLHHAKESALLFPKLRALAPELAPVLDRLDNEHARGERAIRELQRALLAFEVLGEPRRALFEEAVQQYVTFYLEHMAVEEDQILPAAQRLLGDADWAEVDAAFTAHRDLLAAHPPDEEYARLFRLIVAHAAAPVGPGEARP